MSLFGPVQTFIPAYGPGRGGGGEESLCSSVDSPPACGPGGGGGGGGVSLVLYRVSSGLWLFTGPVIKQLLALYPEGEEVLLLSSGSRDY